MLSRSSSGVSAPSKSWRGRSVPIAKGPWLGIRSPVIAQKSFVER